MKELISSGSGRSPMWGKPVPNDYLKRWPVSKRVNSSKADVDDATLVEQVELAAA